jgi:asparagine synthase (glutamine-hydrolysing)
MSVQFGKWNFDGAPIDRTYIRKVQEVLVPYGPDGCHEYTGPDIHLCYLPLHSSKESRSESQPYISLSGRVFTWDGRLDNRDQLIRGLGEPPSDLSDVSIVAAAYERWGRDALPKIIGDWALSVFSPRDRTLLLAKDFLGSRQLYYFLSDRHVTWSTILDPLVLFAGRSWVLDEEYLAGCLSSFPAAELTPYTDVRSVPPSSFVLLKPGSSVVSRHWDFDSARRIQLHRDSEYEEQFRTLFAQSIRRRLRSDAPVLAELSGGVDSSSIVCMADAIAVHGGVESPRLDTLSFFNDAEPNWNERPFFARVEQWRGRTGFHIDVAQKSPLDYLPQSAPFAATPAAVRRTSTNTATLRSHIASEGYRVLLSGIGGDEVLGGVPTPLPELTDLLVTFQLRTLASQLKLWALAKRRPWFHLAFETVECFFPALAGGGTSAAASPAWIALNFAKRHRAALRGYTNRVRIFGPLPSFQANLGSLDVLRRQVATFPPSSDPAYDKRYPYLDRDLLEFLFAIPRDQLVRPHQRRSLMRRALSGIVPDEVLHRRTKASVARGPMTALAGDWNRITSINPQLSIASLGLVNQDALAQAIEIVRSGQVIPLVPILRAIHIECWLSWVLGRRLSDSGDLFIPPRSGSESSSTIMRTAEQFAVNGTRQAAFPAAQEGPPCANG